MFGTGAMIAAVIPMKNPAHSKQRLSQFLSPEERCRLALAMFQDVVLAVRGAAGIGRVVVYGGDMRIAETARRSGCEFLEEAANEGETQAVARATRILCREVEGLLVIPADVPLVQSEDVDGLIRRSDVPRYVTICPSRDRLGTNGVFRSPGDVMPLTFGANSFFPHKELASRLGIPCTVIDLPRLGLDIDRPEDVSVFLEEAGPGETIQYFTSIGMKKRLEDRFRRPASFNSRVLKNAQMQGARNPEE
jgi:2-phospho-L-lactate/phosphoenolpyruvate guanylyltransferase